MNPEPAFKCVYHPVSSRHRENQFNHHLKTLVGLSLSTAGRCCSVELYQAHISYLDFHVDDGSIHYTIPWFLGYLFRGARVQKRTGGEPNSGWRPFTIVFPKSSFSSVAQSSAQGTSCLEGGSTINLAKKRGRKIMPLKRRYTFLSQNSCHLCSWYRATVRLCWSESGLRKVDIPSPTPPFYSSFFGCWPVPKSPFFWSGTLWLPFSLSSSCQCWSALWLTSMPV